MKKLITISAASILLLAGCRDASAQVSNKNEVAFKVGKNSISKQQLADSLAASKYPSTISIMMESLLNEYIPINDDINKKVDEQLVKQKERVAKGTTSWEQSLKNAGFTSEEAYKEQVLVSSVRQKELVKKYLETAFEQGIKKYKPVKINILEAANEEKANAAVSAIESGKSFKDAAGEFGVTTSYSGDPVVAYEGSTAVLAQVYTSALNATVGKVVKIKGTGTTHYVYQVVEKDATKFKEEAIKALESSTTISTEALTYFFTEKKVSIYDIEVYRNFEKNFPTAIANPLSK